MIVRNKGGEYRVESSSVLLDFLRGELGAGSKEGGGEPTVRRSVTGNIELICSVPWCALDV
jgi:hypothetical protein